MLRLRRTDDHQGGQIVVLFALVLVVILAFAAIVIDLGLLRNNRQTLVNTVDAAALAGGTKMPVDGSVAGAVADVEGLIDQTIAANYPGLPDTAYSITYKCLIGTDSSGLAYISRDVPVVCDPSPSLGRAPGAGDFEGAGSTRFTDCDPSVGDKCNVVVVTGSSTTNFSFGRVVGVKDGTTGSIMSASCNGPCGQPPSQPVDVVLIIDRTGSMSGDEDNLENAANTVLSVYDPTIQRVALGTLGPSTPLESCSGVGAHAMPLSLGGGAPPAPSAPAYGSKTDANTTNTSTSLVLSTPLGVAAGHLLVAQVLFNSGSNLAITSPSGWTLVRRTNDGTTNLGQALYYKFAVAGEPATYTWTFGSAVEAAGGILRYTGVDPSNPFVPAAASGSIGTGNFGTGTAQAATGVTTTIANTRIVTFYGHENDTTMSTPTSMNERYERQVNNSGQDLAISADDVTFNLAGATGTKTSNAGSSNRWIAHLLVLRPLPPPPPPPVDDTYGTDTVADLSKWIPVGLTGVGGPVNEAYLNPDGSLNTGTQLVNAISCASNNLSGTGTNLATPIAMARAYLATYGRPDVKKGIIFETDGQPNYNGSSGDPGNYTCAQALTNAAAAKADDIEIYTIGFGVGSGSAASCPDGGTTVNALANMATGPILGGSSCNAAENTDGDHFFCQPAGATLEQVFAAAATELAGLRSHLVQLYPIPIVTAVSPATGTGGATVTITGKFFSGTTSVSFGSAAASSFTVNSDNSITATTPAGSAGSTVNVLVTTPGGTSPIVVADRFTYP